jgi:hypothetical protein
MSSGSTLIERAGPGPCEACGARPAREADGLWHYRHRPGCPFAAWLVERHGDEPR